MKYLYNLIYLLLLVLGIPVLAWRMVVLRKNREGWGHKFLGLVPIRSGAQDCIWIHAVSVGEVNLLPQLVANLKAAFPEMTVAISTTTQSGQHLARQKFPEDLVFYCPSDFSWAVNRSIDRIRPAMLVLTELELWPNLISLTAKREIPVVLINGRVGRKSFHGYRRIRPLIAPVLPEIHHACVQTDEHRERLLRLGVSNDKISVTGNIKFDNAIRLPADDSVLSQIRKIANFSDGDFVFVAGSTLEIEDLLLIDILNSIGQRYPHLRLILVPRHPERVHRIEQHLRRHQIKYSLRSNLSDKERDPSQRVLIVDVIGELSAWWQISDAGFVGGSMGRRGGQNMIEPAALGIPVAFGPDTKNFKAIANRMVSDQCACRVQNRAELEAFVIWTLTQPVLARSMGDRAIELVNHQRGALDRTFETLAALLKTSGDRQLDADTRHAA